MLEVESKKYHVFEVGKEGMLPAPRPPLSPQNFKIYIYLSRYTYLGKAYSYVRSEVTVRAVCRAITVMPAPPASPVKWRRQKRDWTLSYQYHSAP